MTVSADEVHELWDDAVRLRHGPARLAAIDAVVRHADATGDALLAYRVRLGAMWEYTSGGAQARALLAFSHCLAAFDRDPSLGDEHGLLWRFKWAIGALPAFPDVPLDRTYAVLDDMQARYRRAGHGMHAVHQQRYRVARHVGDRAAAEEWMTRMRATALDAMSDCRHCVPSDVVRHLADVGRDEEAIEVGTPYTRGGCESQPQGMLTALLRPYLRTGRLRELADAHRRAYRRRRERYPDLHSVGEHVRLCGVTGNETLGLELIERHRHQLAESPTPADAMHFAAAAGLVLSRLVAAGHGDAPLRAHGAHEPTTVAAAAAELTALARATAARFDARNGTTWQSGLVEETLSAEPVAEVDLATDRRRHRGGA